MGILLISYLVLVFLIEVVGGSSICVYDPELGLDSGDAEIDRLSTHQFMQKIIPVTLSVFGVPILLLLSRMTTG